MKLPYFRTLKVFGKERSQLIREFDNAVVDYVKDLRSKRVIEHTFDFTVEHFLKSMDWFYGVNNSLANIYMTCIVNLVNSLFNDMVIKPQATPKPSDHSDGEYTFSITRYEYFRLCKLVKDRYNLTAEEFDEKIKSRPDIFNVLLELVGVTHEDVVVMVDTFAKKYDLYNAIVNGLFKDYLKK